MLGLWLGKTRSDVQAALIVEVASPHLLVILELKRLGRLEDGLKALGLNSLLLLQVSN